MPVDAIKDKAFLGHSHDSGCADMPLDRVAVLRNNPCLI
jgi:hypothetical protein